MIEELLKENNRLLQENNLLLKLLLNKINSNESNDFITNLIANLIANKIDLNK